ncbi:MAG: leucine-rich repeat domain-containing protein [Promethearchaeota archaeon]
MVKPVLDEIKALIEEDLKSVNLISERPNGFKLARVITWFEKSLKKYPNDQLKLKFINDFVKSFISEKHFGTIREFMLNNYIFLSEENWILFKNVENWQLITQLINKVLPFTNLDRFKSTFKSMTEDDKLDDNRIKKDSELWQVMDNFLKVKPLDLILLLVKIMAGNFKDGNWVECCISMLHLITKDRRDLRNFLIINMSDLIKDCKTAADRRIFRNFLVFNGKEKNLINALIVSGTKSHSLDIDVVEILDDLNPDSVKEFLHDDARVIHRNYFLRLYAMFNPIKSERARLDLIEYFHRRLLKKRDGNPANENNDEVLSKLKDLVLPSFRLFFDKSNKNIDENIQPYLTLFYKATQSLKIKKIFPMFLSLTTRQLRMMVGIMKRRTKKYLETTGDPTLDDFLNFLAMACRDAITILLSRMFLDKILSYIKMSNCWALERQFVSWNKRITKEILLQDRLKELRRRINIFFEKARRKMIFSTESINYLKKAWATRQVLEKRGIEFIKVQTRPGNDENVHPAIRDLLKEIDVLFLRKRILEPQDVYILHIKAARGKLALPIEYKTESIPWVSFQNGLITGLGLSGMKIKKIPRFIRHLKNLKVLDLSNNLLYKIQKNSLPASLIYLDLSRNNLFYLGRSVRLSNLRFLDLHCNLFKEIDIGNFARKLKYLDLSRNQFHRLSKIKGLNKCVSLKHLNLAWCKLKKIEEFPPIPSLTTLSIRGNKIVKLTLVVNLYNLKKLDISDNYLGSFKGFDRIENLVYLNANRNYIFNIKHLKSLKNLRYLYVCDNKIDDLDISLSKYLKSKEDFEFDFSGNPLGKLSVQTMMKYLMQCNNKKIYNF